MLYDIYNVLWMFSLWLLWLLLMFMRSRRQSRMLSFEFGWPVGMPTCRPLGNGLWEVRSRISNGRIVRVIFCIADEAMVLLHGFVKKSQKTPKTDLDLAKSRKKEMEK